MPNRKLNVFLSYAKEDKPTAFELYHQLTAEGWINVWLDEEKLLPGQKQSTEVEKAVETADAVIVCLSNKLVAEEGSVQVEISFIFKTANTKTEEAIFIIPLRLNECDVPHRLEDRYYVDYFPKENRKTAYQRLLESLKLRAARLEIPVDKLAKPSEPICQEPEAKKVLASPISQQEPPASVGTGGGTVERDDIPLDSLKSDKSKYDATKAITPAQESPQKKGASPFKFAFWARFILASVIVLALCGLAVVCIYNWVLVPPKTPTAPPFIPMETRTPTPSLPTETPTIILTPSQVVEKTWILDKDGMVMVSVPAGKFLMGSNIGADDEYPLHEVELAAFWIDRTEVTNAMYAKCVFDGKCNRPLNITYFSNPEYANHPVVYVSWKDANVYCEWRGDGTRLLTEDEWEKAASWDAGKKINRIYPWGNSFDGSLLNFCDRKCSYAWADGTVVDGYTKTAPVGYYTNGASYYGVLDMAGNVWEWVSDWYLPYPGNTKGEEHYGTRYRVRRGGSWYSDDYNSRSLFRSWLSPSNMDDQTGFRCARSQ